MAAVKEKIDEKVNVAACIKEAFGKFGLEVQTAQVQEYVKSTIGVEPTAQYVYLQKSQYKKTLDPESAKGKIKKSRKAKTKTTSKQTKSQSTTSHLVGLVTTIRELIDNCGGKKDLIALIETI